jgi:hypothetical protein
VVWLLLGLFTRFLPFRVSSWSRQK